MMPVQSEKIAFLHIPKTGGRALGALFDRFAASDDPHWFFSFFGNDSSRGANRVMVEAIRPDDDMQRAIAQNPHFQNARIVAGHFSRNLEEFFPGYSFRYITVLREPVERVISNIYQYSGATDSDGRSIFGGRALPNRVEQRQAYWACIGELLRQARGRHVPGLLPHESMMLSNGMCRILSGAFLHTYTPHVSVAAALTGAASTQIAWFSDFNGSVAAALAALGVDLPLDASTNPTGMGDPSANLNRDSSYGCPEDVRNLIAQMNQSDLELYRTLVLR